MADIAQLGIEIDTRKLKSGEKDLASFSSVAKKVDDTVKTATKAVYAMAASFAASGIIKAADSFSTMNARIGRFTDSASEASTVMRELTSYANAAGAEAGSAVSVFVSLSGALQDVGASQSDVLQLTKTLNQLGVIGGSSSEEVSNALRQFSQSMAGGIVRAEEFNSILENTPEIARAIGAGMGLSMGQLRTAMLNGQLTAESVMNSLLSQTDSVNSAFALMPRTVSAAIQSLSNEFTGLIGELNNTTGATSSVSSAIDGASSAIVSMKDNVDSLVTVGEVLLAIYGARLVGGIASSSAAMSALTGITALYRAATTPAIVTTNSLGMAIATTTRAAQVGAVAMSGLRGAMALLGGPAGVIMLAVTAMYAWYSSTQQAKEETISFADSVDTASSSIRSMTSAQLAATQVKLQQSLQAQTDSVNEQKAKVDELRSSMKYHQASMTAWGKSSELSKKQTDELTLAEAELESQENKLSQTKNKINAVTAQLNGTARQNYVLMRQMNQVTGVATGIQGELNRVLSIGNQQLKTRNEYVTNMTGKSIFSAEVQKELTAINANTAALSIQDARLREMTQTRNAYVQAGKYTEQEINALTQAHMAEWDQNKKNEASEKSVIATLNARTSATKDATQAASDYANFSKEISRFNATEAQQIQNWQADQLNQLEVYHKSGVVSESNYAFAKEAIVAESNRRLQKLNDDQWSEYLNGSSAALLKLKQQAQTQLSGPQQQIVVSGIDQKLKDQTFSGLPTIDGGAQSNEQNQIAQLQTQTQAMNDAYNQRIEQYKLYRQSEVENAAYYDSQIQALEDKKKANNEAAQAAMLNLQLSTSESMAASAADGIKSVLGEQSSAYRVMFAMQKGFAIAQSMMAIQTGIAQAASLPFPENLGAMATVVSATANIVSSIASVAAPSFDGGGYTGNGSRSGGLDGKGGFWAMMHPRETVIDHTKQGSQRNLSANTQSNAYNNVTVNQTINTTGRIDSRTSNQIASDTARKQRLASRLG